MAKPRVFISSTYYDLRNVRANLERFVREMGYEPVLFERGHVPYAREDALEQSCYREIANCDIVVSIVGGQYGTQSQDDRHSISQMELTQAVELGKQIYVFVEKAVLADYKTWLKNRSVTGFVATSVNDCRVFAFVEEIYNLSAGNPIHPFELSEDIVQYLREQWAGLFQNLLQQSARRSQIEIVEGLLTTADTLKTLVAFLTEERAKGDGAIRDILMSTHPAFGAIKTVAQIQYRVTFHSLKELDALLSARGFEFDKTPTDDSVHEWDNEKLNYGIRVKKDIFESDGRLKIIQPQNWKKEYVARYEYSGRGGEPADPDDLPF